MIRFENKTFSSGNLPGLKCYSELAMICVNNSSEGMDIAEIKERLDLMTLFESDTIELNQKQIDKLKKLVEQTKWRIVDRVLVEFSDYVKSLKE